MKSYKLTIAYDATGYYGWQVQNNKPSIAHTINQAFVTTFKRDMRVLGTSRTDAGVHALGQVARARTDLIIDPEKLRWVWNNSLPPEIMIRSLELVDDQFNPFHGVEQKIYYYHFFLDRPTPFLQRYGYFYPYKVDRGELEHVLRYFIGTHDFISLRSVHDTRENTIRTIDDITLEYFKRYNAYRVIIKGQKFLRHMIRRMVGAALFVATKGGGGIQLLQHVMDAKNPAHVLPNAPAQGLLLYKIIYK